jgi:hypothetical protein
VFIALVAWITVTRRDVRVGHNAESQQHPHHVPVLASETE